MELIELLDNVISIAAILVGILIVCISTYDYVKRKNAYAYGVAFLFVAFELGALMVMHYIS